MAEGPEAMEPGRGQAGLSVPSPHPISLELHGALPQAYPSPYKSTGTLLWRAARATLKALLRAQAWVPLGRSPGHSLPQSHGVLKTTPSLLTNIQKHKPGTLLGGPAWGMETRGGATARAEHPFEEHSHMIHSIGHPHRSGQSWPLGAPGHHPQVSRALRRKVGWPDCGTL